MKNLLLLVSVLISSVIFAQGKKDTIPPLESMITIINNSFDKANSKLGKDTIKIQTAEITLQTSYEKSGGGEFKLFVKASQKWELEKASSMTFKYEILEKTGQKSVKFFKKPVFEENLTNAIISAAKQWLNTKATVVGLSKSEFTVEISFSIKKVTSTGIEFEIWGIGADISGEYANTAVHKVILTFK